MYGKLLLVKVVYFAKMLHIGSYVREVITFEGFVFLVFQLFGQFMMLVGR